ncbi:MAG: prepilin-type N-terminal cleavage/methylation domain-containing protein [Limisphaerales bacterium]|jgi:prepilin-type N-terminal cleavage/methylation domain-containing protein
MMKMLNDSRLIRSPERKAFMLVELLVVIAIIGVLAASMAVRRPVLAPAT